MHALRCIAPQRFALLLHTQLFYTEGVLHYAPAEYPSAHRLNSSSPEVLQRCIACGCAPFFASSMHPRSPPFLWSHPSLRADASKMQRTLRASSDRIFFAMVPSFVRLAKRRVAGMGPPQVHWSHFRYPALCKTNEARMHLRCKEDMHRRACILCSSRLAKDGTEARDAPPFLHRR